MQHANTIAFYLVDGHTEHCVTLGAYADAHTAQHVALSAFVKLALEYYECTPEQLHVEVSTSTDADNAWDGCDAAAPAPVVCVNNVLHMHNVLDTFTVRATTFAQVSVDSVCVAHFASAATLFAGLAQLHAQVLEHAELFASVPQA